ncbi:glutaredoxin [Acinetobacter phage ZZ1]|uniref:Glutaredoxin n=1 Tax=Acinetobacter phage ZZ1 TaxID=1049283 RepID=I3WVF1_9CAUD|nr:glutaredoxin [Acinetobacter phage ZZ1]AFL47471.1 glutaredoxin [Acinetobacter phage ZZ1]
MKIEIYGIDEPNYRCAGCEQVKKICEESGHKYKFNRIIVMKDGVPTKDDDILHELKQRIEVGILKLPYIFIDNNYVTFSEFKDLIDY